MPIYSHMLVMIPDENGTDVVIAGHKNRFMGSFTSWSAKFINPLSVDVLIHHVAKIQRSTP